MNDTLCHFFGDYLLQSDYMANNKTKSSRVAAAHVATYILPFLFLRPTWRSLVGIAGTHFLIDRYRLARYAVWAKNFLALKGEDHTLTATGMPETTPIWLSTWLLIIADNTIHLLLNRFFLDRWTRRGYNE